QADRGGLPGVRTDLEGQGVVIDVDVRGAGRGREGVELYRRILGERDGQALGIDHVPLTGEGDRAAAGERQSAGCIDAPVTAVRRALGVHGTGKPGRRQPVGVAIDREVAACAPLRPVEYEAAAGSGINGRLDSRRPAVRVDGVHNT